MCTLTTNSESKIQAYESARNRIINPASSIGRTPLFFYLKANSFLNRPAMRAKRSRSRLKKDRDEAGPRLSGRVFTGAAAG